jgi:hypothetical protein
MSKYGHTNIEFEPINICTFLPSSYEGRGRWQKLTALECVPVVTAMFTIAEISEV